ncbi:MAG: carboxypeptidase regulatory-like domain-containing protein [Gemmatimonadaceae bacterium]
MFRLAGFKRVTNLCFAVALVLIPRALLIGQATAGVLHGLVRGDDGTIPSNARIEIRSPETAAIRQVTADEKGGYTVLGLAPGVYELTIRSLGYREHRRDNVRLILGQRSRLDFTLEHGPTELEPVVVSESRVTDLSRTDISTAVVAEEIAKLPVNTRNLLNLAAIAPGVRTFSQEAGRSIPSAGALSGVRFINLYVDGVEWKGTYIGNLIGAPGLGSLIPQEAVREFRVYLNPYDVEYTRGASWVISAVTHRGGNDTEGSIFGFLQSSPLVAKGTFQGSKPAYDRLQSGGNIRGALVKDRLFYSLTYEGQRTDNYVDVVPGQPAENPGIWDRYAGAFRAPLRMQSGVLRLTAPLRSHTIDAIWASRRLSNESDFGTSSGTVMLSHDAGLLLRHSLNSMILRDTYASASVVNELSLHVLKGVHRELPLWEGPTFQYPGIQTGRVAYRAFFDTQHIRAVNKTAWMRTGPRGQHTIKSGVELTAVRVDTYRPTARDGVFEFQFDTSTTPLRAQIAMGANDPASTREARDIGDGWLVGAYLQDEWQPVPSITLTAGVRYDAEINTLNQGLVFPWANDTTLLRAYGENFLNGHDRKNDLDNLAPRLGIAWDMFGSRQTTLRAGYGILYDRVPVFGAQNESIGAGWRTYTFLRPGTTDPAELRRRIAAGGGSATPNLTLLKDRLETPRNRQWSVGVGHRFANAWTMNVDYLDQRLRNTYVTVRTNLRDPVSRLRPITDRFGDITLWDDFGDARFRALLASASYDRATTRLNLAYTLGWAESEFGELTTSDYPAASFYTMQRSDADERHRIVGSGFRSLPWGLDLSGIATTASPRPFLVTTGTDDNQNGTAVDDWPGGVRTRRRNGWEHWYRTVDLRLAKTFTLGTRRMIVTAEVFNAFNSANHAEYQAKENLLDYGAPVGDYARRQAQLGVRYQF